MTRSAGVADTADAADRDAAIHERKRNVLIDAGAGTGKTTILVARLVELIAPSDDTDSPIPIDRIAAVTFTRKAAGELRLRIREKLLATLADPQHSPIRRERLREALGGLDAAALGTIHSFADRLLRLHPIEAMISPRYEICEDIESLVAETTEALQHGAERGILAALLEHAPPVAKQRAKEAEDTTNFYLSADLRTRESVRAYVVYSGLDSAVRGFVLHRDHPPSEPSNPEFDVRSFRRVLRTFTAEVAELKVASKGTTWLRERGLAMQALLEESDPGRLYAEVRARIGRLPDLKKKTDFPDDKEGWAVWKRLRDATDDDGPSLKKQILAPLQAWMAARLVRLFPVVVALYERAKERISSPLHVLTDGEDRD